MNIHDILWSNQGQRLTPELIVGILHGATTQPDNALINTIGDEKEEYNGVTFQVERLADCFDEVVAQHQAQWDEVEKVREDLNPDYEGVLARERAGTYVLFTARKDGELVGNTGCYLFRSMHNQDLSAKEDTMYLAPEVRKGRTAIKFFRYCESQLRRTGVEEITVQVKTTNKAYMLWEREGYTWTDRVLTKTFGSEV